MCYKQCQWRNSLNTKQLLPRQWNCSEWTSILSSSVHLRIIHIAFSLNLRYQLPVITSPNLVYVYIYRYMTYMGFQICVSTHGDLRLKMSKQVRSIWKISIHLIRSSYFLPPMKITTIVSLFSTNLHQILQVFHASHWGWRKCRWRAPLQFAPWWALATGPVGIIPKMMFERERCFPCLKLKNPI